MSGRERVLRALRGEAVDAAPTAPLAVHYCARMTGISLREYSLDAEKLAAAVIAYYDRFRPDAVWVSADTWITAEAMGAEVTQPDPGQPFCGCGSSTVRNIADVQRIDDPAPAGRGRQRVIIEATRRVADTVAGRAAVVACFDQYPFSLACNLVGNQQLMYHLVDDTDWLESLLQKAADYVVAYGIALAEAGADVLSGGDSPAGLIGPDRYREVALPYEQQVIRRLQEITGLPVSLHICGNASPLLPAMVQSGADCLELDYQVDMPAALSLAAASGTAVWGNLDPVSVLARSDAQSVRRSTRELAATCASVCPSRHVISSGCTLAWDTPAENLRALLTACMDVGENG